MAITDVESVEVQMQTEPEQVKFRTLPTPPSNVWLGQTPEEKEVEDAYERAEWLRTRPHPQEDE